MTLVASIPRVIPVPRERGLSVEEIVGRYQNHGRPVVIENATPRWVDLWTPAKLQETLGDREILVEQPYGFADRRPLVPVKLEKFVAALEEGTTSSYLRGGYSGLAKYLPEILRPFLDVDYFRSYSRQPTTVESVSLWLQPKDHFSFLHIDSYCDNIHTVVHGRKRFLIAPPTDFASYYHYGWRTSPVDPFAPDLERFPRFGGLTLYSADLGPGDMLYTPGHWWHSAIADEICISANRWFEPATGLLPQLRQCPLRDKLALIGMHFLYQGITERLLTRLYELVRPREGNLPAHRTVK